MTLPENNDDYLPISLEPPPVEFPAPEPAAPAANPAGVHPEVRRVLDSLAMVEGGFDPKRPDTVPLLMNANMLLPLTPPELAWIEANHATVSELYRAATEEIERALKMLMARDGVGRQE